LLPGAESEGLYFFLLLVGAWYFASDSPAEVLDLVCKRGRASPWAIEERK
jgi:hypothetical protein